MCDYHVVYHIEHAHAEPRGICGEPREACKVVRASEVRGTTRTSRHASRLMPNLKRCGNYISAAVTAARVSGEDAASTAADAMRPSRQNRQTLTSDVATVASTSCVQVPVAATLLCIDPSLAAGADFSAVIARAV
jgi:hypothetical protein